jgi:predicted AAA+ superfamily ATPase
MFARVRLPDLILWAKRDKRKPLILRGARQVGKSTLVNLLAEALSLDCVTLNFEKTPSLADLFKSNEPETIVNLISIKLNRPIKAGTTLLFLDEIQARPEILLSLRYFYEEMPELHVICAGSLLEFALEQLDFSMPVGRIEYAYLGPMSFMEFLWALGEQGLAEFLSSYQLNQEIPDPIHHKCLELLKHYLIIGGMPEAIQQYVTYRDLLEVERAKRSILETYEDDLSKYASKRSLSLLRQVFDKVPRLVSKHIKYSEINSEVKSTVVAEALHQLDKAKVITEIYRSSSNGVPLGAQLNEKIFKLIFLDVGLLSTQLDLSFLDLHEINELTLVHQGVIAEQFIGQHLLYLRPFFEPPSLYYWQRDKKSSQAEIDYVISHRQKVIPIEVKAGKAGTLKSMHLFMEEKDLDFGLRFSSNLPDEIMTSANKKILTLPLYLITELHRLIQD